MRLTSVICICICSLLFVTSCDSPRDSKKDASALDMKFNDYSVKKKTGPLSDEEIKTYFSALGLHCKRVSIMMPQRRTITFTTERFKSGSSIGIGGAFTTFLDKGLQDVIICMAQSQDNNQAKVSIYNSGGGAGFLEDLEDRGATTSSLVPLEKITSQKQPIYFFAANEKGIESYYFNDSDFDKEEFVKKYEFAMIVYAQLEEEDSDSKDGNRSSVNCAN